MNKTGKRMRIVIGVTLIAAAAAFPFIFASCTPGDSITASESDVVATLYDNTFDFNSIKNYFMPDTILHLTGDPDVVDDPNLNRSNDVFIRGEIVRHLADLGYVRVAAGANPDFIVTLGATSTDTYSVYSWYPGWYYPGYPSYWYPNYGYTSVSYAYTTGTLIVVLADEKADPANGLVDVWWNGNLNGVLNDSSVSIRTRLTSGIDQMFEQSPYLGTNQ
ncbi:MAG: DUF4136 domain-containing protein [Thermoguttaceae bacterium]